MWKNKKKLLIVLSVITLVSIICFIGISYAWIYQTLRGNKTYSLKVQGYGLKLNDTSTSSNIKIENSTPVSDTQGKTTSAYTFSLINEESSQTGYILYLDDVSINDEINRMKDTNVKYQLIEDGNEKVGLVSELGTHPFRILTNGVINGKSTKTYSLRFWIKETAEISANQIFSVSIRVIATSKEAISDGKLVFGETIVISDSGITSMTTDQLQTYVDKALGNKIETELNKQAEEYEEKLNQKEKEILDKNHPVGSIYISETNANPSKIFGGTWVTYGQGRTLVGLDSSNTSFNTAGKTGRNTNGKTTLTTAQLPSHNHGFTPSGSVKSTFTGNQVNTSTNGEHKHNAYIYTDSTGYDQTIPANQFYIYRSNLGYASSSLENRSSLWVEQEKNGSHAHTVTAAGTVASTFTGTKSTTQNTGSGESFSTQDPYITVYMWKRIS